MFLVSYSQMYLYSSSVGFSVCLDNRGFSLHFFFHLALTDLESLTSSVNNHNNNTKKIIKFAFPFLILFSYQKFFFPGHRFSYLLNFYIQSCMKFIHLLHICVLKLNAHLCMYWNEPSASHRIEFYYVICRLMYWLN